MTKRDMSLWQNSINKMEKYLDKLLSQSPRLLDDCSDIPKRGVYVFHDKGKPIYTGRTNSMRSRLRGHCRPSSGHESATFAFNLAKKEFKSSEDGKLTRKQLQQNPGFTKLYDKAKARVSRMHICYIEINDPIEQTLFEVYASIALDTMEYNKFENH